MNSRTGDVLSLRRPHVPTVSTVREQRGTEARREAKWRVEREDMIGLSQCRKIVSFGPVLRFPAL